MDLRKFSKYAFFAFLFLLPFQTVLLLREPIIGGEKWQYGTIGLYGTDILLILSVFFAFLSSVIPAKAGIQKDNSGSRVPPKAGRQAGMTTLSLMALVLWAGLSILWSPDQMLAGYFFMKLLLGAGVFFLARSLDESDMKTAVKVLLAAAVIQGVIGIGQFVFQESVSSSLLGMSAHESWTAGTSVLKLEEGRFLRAYGSFPHPNVLGGFLAIILVIAIADFRFRIADLKKRNNSAFYILHSAFLILILLSLILTFSRAAWLGAALGIGMIVFFQKSQIINHKSKIIFGVIGMAVVVFVFVLRDQVFPRFDVTTIEREGSVSERMVSLEDARALIIANPIAGVGAGNFTKAIMKNEPTRPVWSVQPAHNVFVLIFAELGAVGVLLFVGFIVSVAAVLVRRLWRLSEKIQDTRYKIQDMEPSTMYRASFITPFLALLPSLLLDHWLWSSHFGLLFLFLIVGFMVRRQPGLTRDEFPGKKS